MVPMHTPPWQASSPVQALPSSQVVPSRTVVPMHTPLWQVSPLVQALPSSHGVLSGSGVPAQTPSWQVSLLVQEFSSSHAAPSSSAALPTQVPFWQVSAAVQALPSSHAAPVLGVTVQLDVPLQVCVLHWSEVQVIAVPTHWPLPSQVSLKEQASPSSQLVPVSGVTVQLDVPLQVRVLHWSEVQVIAVPTHWPLPSQVSLKEQASPSSQLVPLSGVTVQLDVPLQVRVLHWSEVQVIAVPTHWPLPSQVSLKEQASPSSQLVPVSGVTVQLDVPLQVRVLHWSEVQVIAVPTHWPLPSQVSLKEQASPSSQLVPLSGVTVQLDVPLQVRVLHWSEVQVIAVPTHWPLPSQVSLKEQASPSSQLVPVSGVTVQLDVPLQVRVLHWSEVQVIAVPTHWPLPSQVSLKEQASPSSQLVPVSGVTVQLAVPLQVRVLHVSEVHVTAVLWQTPASQLSMVQAFPSLQSATVEQGEQPAMGVLLQTPASQDSVVQAFWSSQSAAVEQSVQPAMGVPSHCPLPSQTSLKVQALPSSHGVLAGCKASGGQ